MSCAISKIANTLILLGLISIHYAHATSVVPNTTGTAFAGECIVRLDSQELQSLGTFNLVVNNNQEDCPHQVFSLVGFHPLAKGNDIYVEYQGPNASPKMLTDSEIGYNDIRLYNAQVGNHLSALLTLNNGREVYCSGNVAKIQE